MRATGRIGKPRRLWVSEGEGAETLHDRLNPLATPCGRLERIREILGFVNDLAVGELHNAHGVRGTPLIGDGVFRDPEICSSENSPDVET